APRPPSRRGPPAPPLFGYAERWPKSGACHGEAPDRRRETPQTPITATRGSLAVHQGKACKRDTGGRRSMRHRAALTYRHIRIKLAATSTEEPACLAILIGPSV